MGSFRSVRAGLVAVLIYFGVLAIIAPNFVAAETVEAEVTTAIDQVVSLSAEDLTINRTLSGETAFVTGTLGIDVMLNTTSGYSISFEAAGTNLVGSIENIPTISVNGRTQAQILADTSLTSAWAWSNEATPSSYNAIPTTSTQVVAYTAEDTYAQEDEIPLTFGFKLAPTLASGKYTQTITITMVANPEADNSTIFDMTTMQDLASHISACANTPTPSASATESITSLPDHSVNAINIDRVPTVNLTDTRDGNVYTVKKLADGNCWMTSDLRLNKESLLSHGTTTLTLSNTNTTTDFSVANLPSTDTVSGTTISGGASDYVNSKVIYVGPDANAMDKDHYLYNWHVAILESDNTSVNGSENPTYGANVDAPDSLCPAGWQLPNGTGNKSWAHLLLDGEGVYEIAGSDASSYAQDKDVSMLTSNPFNLVPTASIDQTNLANTGESYFYWTRTSGTNTGAHAVYVATWGVYIQNWFAKNDAFAIRCVNK